MEEILKNYLKTQTTLSTVNVFKNYLLIIIIFYYDGDIF